RSTAPRLLRAATCACPMQALFFVAGQRVLQPFAFARDSECRQSLSVLSEVDSAPVAGSAISVEVVRLVQSQRQQYSCSARVAPVLASGADLNSAFDSDGVPSQRRYRCSFRIAAPLSLPI